MKRRKDPLLVQKAKIYLDKPSPELASQLIASIKEEEEKIVDPIERILTKQIDKAGAKTDTRILAILLKNNKFFDQARSIFETLSVPTDINRESQLKEMAICTYKDPDLPGSTKFDDALKLMDKIEVKGVNYLTNPDLLGIVGAIYKRKWEFNSQLQNLDYALHYYKQGYAMWEEGGKPVDDGYTAINAAYVIDLLAHQEINERAKLKIKINQAEQFEEARQIRQRIIDYFKEAGNPKNKDWITKTIAEAYFGLKQFGAAKQELAKLDEDKESWEFETTARQLASIAQIQIDLVDDKEEKKELRKLAEEALNAYVHDLDGVNSAFTGKVGLALSGGGFRASLYHIGVLAKLAELGMLKHVETLSCVSGGSILGVYYYLLLKNKLEEKADEELRDEDYIQIVKKLEEKFLADIACNIRMKVFEKFKDNWKFFFKSGYSRTHKLAELYEEVLYQDLFPNITKGTALYMHDLIIEPKGENRNFNIKKDNWRRKHKIPKLIINATTLNTGHNWQFTATFMGEPPGNIITEVDAKYRLKRMYYYEAPPLFQNIRLGQAVAASSGVPGVFPPLTFNDLYDDVKVQLVDGGVHDNQGAAGLLEQECTILLVSDASGQITTHDASTENTLGILTRTNDILMERVREGGFQDLKYRKDAGLAKHFLFVHLTKDLRHSDKPWATHPEKIKNKKTEKALYKGDTKYEIPKKIQKLLAEIRTDLDAFNKTEAYALMYSGYKMTEWEEAANKTDIFNEKITKSDWNFLKVASLLDETVESDDLPELLKISSETMFKSILLSNRFKLVKYSLFGLLAVIGGLLVWKFSDLVIFQLKIGTIGIGIGMALLIMLLTPLIGGELASYAGWLNFKGKLRGIFTKVGMAFVLFVIAKIHLKTQNDKYLERGDIE